MIVIQPIGGVGRGVERAITTQKFLSPGALMPFRFLLEKEVGQALRREFLPPRCGLLALDHRQACLSVLAFGAEHMFSDTQQ